MVGVENNLNYYDILQVSKDSKEYEIRNNYKKLVLQFHPDLNKNKDTTNNFKNILKAYSILKDENLRAQYDLELKNKNNFRLKTNFKYEYKKIKEKTDKLFNKIKLIFSNITIKSFNNNQYEIIDDNFMVPDEILNLPVHELEERLLYSNNHYVRFNSALAIGFKKCKTSLNILEAVIYDESLNVRKAIIWAIGNIGMKKSLHTLKKMYNSIESTLRLDIIKSVYKITGKNSLLLNELLSQGVKDPSDEVKCGCYDLIQKLGKKIRFVDQQESLIFSNV